MSTATYVDNMLIEWGERSDWSPQFQKPKINKRSVTGLMKVVMQAARPPMTAQVARQKLSAFAKNTPQVLVKISGGGKGLRAVMAHLGYISRHGDLAIEDEQGNTIDGKAGLDDLRWAWGEGGYPMPEDSEFREAINIVLSMPEGTDELSVLRAAREFAKAEFGANHQYALALHTFATDPSSKPSKHPHVHLAVKARGFDGSRLNPRKADLMDWREGFAKALRDNGVQAIATRRRDRLVREKGQSQAVKQLVKRGVVPRRVATAKAQPVAVKRAKANADRAIKEYRIIAESLATSNTGDRKLAIDLVNKLKDVDTSRLKGTNPRPAMRPQKGEPMPDGER